MSLSIDTEHGPTISVFETVSDRVGDELICTILPFTAVVLMSAAL